MIIESVTWGFDNRIVATRFLCSCEKIPKHKGAWGSHLHIIVFLFSINHHIDRREHCNMFSCFLESLCYEIGGGSFSFCSCDTDDNHITSRIPRNCICNNSSHIVIWYTDWTIKWDEFSKKVEHILNIMKKWLVFNYKIDLYSTIMAKLTIQTWETNDILRTLSTPILQSELRKYRSLAEDMVKYIKNSDNGWVGLAAPQVWVNKRLIVVSLMKTYDDENFRTIALINPEIIEHSEEKCSESEGCLSVPGESGDVERWNWIKVNFLDIEWKKYSLHLTDLAARIVQHEIDHLDGILFTDRLVSSIFTTNTTL